MDNAMLDYQALCWWLYIYVDGIFKDLANLFQLVISTPSITCPLSNKHPSFSLEFKISEEIRYRKNNAKYKGNSPGKQRLGETWRIYIISKELYCFTSLLTSQVQIQVKIQMLPKNGTQEKVISASTCTTTNTQNLRGYPVEGFVQNILDSWTFLIIVDDAGPEFLETRMRPLPTFSLVRLG